MYTDDIPMLLASPAAPGGGSLLVQFLPILLMFVALYLFLIRPNQKRQRVRNMMLANLKKGDKVLTLGGIYGTIVDLTDDQVILLVNDVTKITFSRSAMDAVVDASGTSS